MANAPTLQGAEYRASEGGFAFGGWALSRIGESYWPRQALERLLGPGRRIFTDILIF
jgi:hypothetical protein